VDSDIDRDLYRWVNRLADRTSWAHGAFKANAEFGIVLFAALLLAAFVDARTHDRAVEVAGSIWAGAAALVALGIGQLIGGAVDRLRPYESMSDVHVLVHRTTDFSIPSDHATAAGAVAIGLLLTNKRWGVPAVVAAVVMAFTRVYVGAHYPSDVVAGLALGGIVALVGHRLIVPSAGRVVSRLAATPMRPLVSAARR
jgi:undecaprenyl-diphosphatase